MTVRAGIGVAEAVESRRMGAQPARETLERLWGLKSTPAVLGLRLVLGGRFDNKKARRAEWAILDDLAGLKRTGSSWAVTRSPRPTTRPGETAGGLSFFMAKLAWTGPRIKPWISYARSKEPFEAGRGAVQSFRADHYGAGAAFDLGRGWELEPSFSYEKRLPSGQYVNAAGLGLSYSWGNAKAP